MHLKAATLDDLLERVFKALLKSKVRVAATKGTNVELSGVVLELTQPRARLSRTESKGHAFSCLGEFVWYLSCSKELEYIQYYLKDYGVFAEDDGTVWGAYGPRIFDGVRSQYEIVRETLERKRDSRQAVIQLFDREDIEKPYKDVPCTCTLQFIIRDGLLHMIVHMRSNDAYLGLPHDIFAFTMIQEILARDLGQGLGVYKHLVGSLHLYDDDRGKVRTYLNEGFQSTREMPAMPAGIQWKDIKQVFVAEAALRSGRAAAVDAALATARELTPYWADIIRLFAIYALTKGVAEGNALTLRKVVEIQRAITSSFYVSYVRKRAKPLVRAVQQTMLMERGPADMGQAG